MNTLADGKIEAALVVFTCEPNSDTASVTGKAKIYMAKGDTLEEALYLAEQQQNKKVFYAQNELLLLGPGATKNISSYLSYFGQEDVGRLNLSVYLTELEGDEFSKCDDIIENVIQEGERLTDRTLTQASPAKSIYESIPGEKGESGWLPVLEFSPEEDYIGVKKAFLFKEDQCYEVWNATELQVALMLDGKSQRLSTQAQYDGQEISLKTGPLTMETQVLEKEDDLLLQLSISGRLEHLSIDGKTVSINRSSQELIMANRWLVDTVSNIVSQTFYEKNDVFQWEWWLRLHDAKRIEAWKSQDQMESHIQIQVIGNLSDS